MPRYFFYLDDDDGNGGLEYADDAAARQAAMETLGAMISEGSVTTGAHMRVTDQTGRQVVNLKFLADH
jgi:hypothetical protein